MLFGFTWMLADFIWNMKEEKKKGILLYTLIRLAPVELILSFVERIAGLQVTIFVWFVKNWYWKF